MPQLFLPQFVPHDGQKILLRKARKRNVACMGRRFGKTLLMQEVILNYQGGALAGYNGDFKKGSPTAWYAPNDSYFVRVYQDIAWQYAPLIKKSTSHPRPVIEFINGGRIDFWTLEQPMKCGRGSFYSRVVIDEAAHARHLEKAWEQSIVWTLADLRGDAWFISTPNGLNYFYELFNREKVDKDWISHTAPSFHNPHLSQKWINNQKQNMPALVFAQEVLAEFITFGAGLVRPEHLISATTPNSLPIVLGVDLAISEKESADWTVIVAMGKDVNDGLIYIKEVERFRGNFFEVTNRIKMAAARHHPKMIVIEQVQFQAAVVQELHRNTFLPVRGIRPDKDKVTRFHSLLTRYEQKMVRHDPSGVPAWFTEELLSFPENKHDDGVDAAVYAFEALQVAAGGYSGSKNKSDFW